VPFVQLIEFQTDNIAEFNATVDEWLETSKGWRTATRAALAQDRDRPGTYLQMVEFPTYEAAMENSNRPETTKFSERLAALCTSQPVFRNLDVERIDHM
jgi:quinol monooxygenase YgiN